MIDFEPFKPINKSIYFCDGKFHTDELESLLENETPFGFIVVDGSGTLYGKLSGNTREVVSKFEVDLPKKHKKCWQPSNERSNYIIKAFCIKFRV